MAGVSNNSGASQLNAVMSTSQNHNEMPSVVSDEAKKDEGRPLTPGSSAEASTNEVLGGPEYTNEGPTINIIAPPSNTIEDVPSYLSADATADNGNAIFNATPHLSSDSDDATTNALPPPPPFEKLAQKNPKPTDHLSITIGPLVILLFDIVIPCIIYYVWFDIHRSSLEIPELYLYSPGFLMSFLGIVMLISLIPFKIPIGINSHARGSPMRPFIYYAAEDFIAVDGLQDREFRVRYNARYDSSPGFRRMFLHLTLWWIAGVLVYLGCLSAVIWSLEFHYAFGLSLGVLFAYLVIWALVSYYWVDRVMKSEQRAHDERVAKC
ncbi:hypothetical protein SS1G_06984 [Sclerotinia sclerotiorum 1980 UF-70]|uniref:Uncharacterized protein n=1 Tax=Sclerotinia sclerotiorum (strain ATCC 18683 / 1980 / Ss-1) TaxID=665079 RepID=A7ENT5_SCLS1|nr:hypothetical protein SS1G_06984 [Sclerotinia sclerotiorum 1980 UF-70]EDO04501.1 hypothetical protein SS1G_06984 [Sclerotinia sclerotiorum 1980 UF-70]